jgi:hypothetical protein
VILSYIIVYKWPDNGSQSEPKRVAVNKLIRIALCVCVCARARACAWLI